MIEPQSRLVSALAERYRLERELGRGGTATVYLAHDVRHDRPVAVKVLYPELAASLGPARFLREVEIAQRLDHPNILPLYDSGETAGFLYYVMPYVEGESLRHRLRREIQMPVEEAVRIAREVAEALGHAHRQGIVHRDIKPENILLQGDRALVADFGVARAIESAASERLTETGLAVGTAAYMSPEQADGGGQVDGRSDLYSLGCVLYEMLAGEPPFGGGTPRAIIAKHMQAPVPDLRVVRSTVSARLQRVVRKALAKVPADRYGSAEDFADALGDRAVAEGGTAWRSAALWGMGAAGILALAALGSRLPLPGGLADYGSEKSSTPAPRIAVLYFDDLAGDSAIRRLADGITEELIYELSGVQAFRVVSRNAVAPFRGRRAPLDSMVSALRVGTVIDGGVQRWRSGIRARVQLIDAASGTYIDSLSVTRADMQSAGMVRSMAQELAAGLRRRLGREERLRTAPPGWTSVAARDLLLRARRAREEAAVMAEHPHPADVRTARRALERADSLLAEAETLDPRWTAPPIERGWVARDRAGLEQGAGRVAAARNGLRFAQASLQQSPGNLDALELRGSLRWELVTELQASRDDAGVLQAIESDLRAVLERDSTRARAWATLSYVLWFKGNTAEAALAARRALREDAYLADARGTLVRLFNTDLMLGDFSGAAEWCQRGRATFPQHWRFVECELTLMRHDQDAPADPGRAWDLVAELERLDPADAARAAGRQYHPIYRRLVAASISARGGDPGRARRELARALSATAGDSTLRLDMGYDQAYLHLLLGDRRRAADLLRRYVEARPMARDYLARDPLFRDLRED